MQRLLLLLTLPGLLPAGSLPEGWTRWAARDEIAPRTFVEGDWLGISGNSNAAVYGGWVRTVAVEAGRWYRLEALYRSEGVPYEQLQIVSRLDWVTAEGKRAGQPDYAWRTRTEGDWRRVTLEAPAPPKATAVKIQLYLANAPQGTVWWNNVSLSPIAAPSPRVVRVAAINLRPRDTGSAEASVGKFIEAVEAAVPPQTDLILLPEGITVVGTGKAYAEVAETVPGPTTGRLGELARRKKAYIAAGIYEREGVAIYNTAVLIDRAGKVVGKYRKVYLPREEIEGGLTPGNDFPVFKTDFGAVGMMICWDLQYADPARALSLRGAELLLLPIWGGNLALGKARAIENHVFLATSGYDYPTYLLDPDGEIVAQAQEQGQAAVATLDLNRRYVDPWLGEMRGRFMKEMRVDLR